MKKNFNPALIILIACSANSCASMEDSKRTAETGAAIGAALGGIIGHQSGRSGQGAVIGGIGGAAVGYGASKAHGSGLEDRRRRNETSQQGNLNGPIN